MQSLRDKLLKAGLVTEEQAQKSEQDAKQAKDARRSAHSGGPGPTRGPRPGGPGAGASAGSGAPGGNRRPEGGHQRRPHGGPGQRRPENPRPEGARAEGARPAQRPAGGPGHGGSRGAGGGHRSGPRPDAAGAGTGAIRIPKLPPLPGSREHQRMISRKQLELDKALLEYVMFGEVEIEAGETAFYFLTRKGRLRRMEISADQAKKLETGELAVVEKPEPSKIEHALVMADVASRMFELSERSVRFLNRSEKPVGFMTDDELHHQQEREAARVAAGEAAGAASNEPDASVSAEASATDEGSAEVESASDSAVASESENAAPGETESQPS